MSDIRTSSARPAQEISRSPGKTPCPSPGLPVALGPARPRPSLHISRIPAHFLSHLIAEYNNLPTQRQHRRAPLHLAASAYARARHNATRSMPAGFNFQLKA